MRVYRLDLESLLPSLGEFQQTGSLTTKLPPGSLKQKGPCKVRVDLLQGKVVYCHIEDSAGRIYILDSRKIVDTLYGLGELDWRLDEGIDKIYTPPEGPPSAQVAPRQGYSTEQLSSRQGYSTGQLSSLPYPPPTQHSPMSQSSAQRRSVSELVPRVVATPDASILNMLSRNQRRVLVLVDGTRSVKKITEILFASSQDMRPVLQVLRELENMGLITIVG